MYISKIHAVKENLQIADWCKASHIKKKKKLNETTRSTKKKWKNEQKSCELMKLDTFYFENAHLRIMECYIQYVYSLFKLI